MDEEKMSKALSTALLIILKLTKPLVCRLCQGNFNFLFRLRDRHLSPIAIGIWKCKIKNSMFAL